MSRTYSILRSTILVLVAVTILGGVTWANISYARKYHDETNFLVPWLAARTFLQYGDSPYGEAASQRAQIIYYGKLATQDKDPLRLNLPFPVEIFFIPLAFIPDYAVARGIFMTILEAGLVFLGLFSLDLAGWKTGRLLLLNILVFSILWTCAYLSLTNGREVILTAVATAGTFLALRDKRDELAGALMVVMLAKLSMTGIILIFLTWWLLYNRRYRVFAGFLMSLFVVLALSFFLQLDWFFPFLRNLAIHTKFNPGNSTISLLTTWFPAFGQRLGWGLTAILLVLLFAEWRSALRKDFHHLFWAICLTVACTPLIGFRIKMDDNVFLIMPIILFISIMVQRWSKPGKQGMAHILLLVTIVGVWSAYILFSITERQEFWQGLLLFGLPFILIIGLYWMRWWVVNPPRTWRDAIS